MLFETLILKGQTNRNGLNEWKPEETEWKRVRTKWKQVKTSLETNGNK